jgi:hypothetical protein
MQKYGYRKTAVCTLCQKAHEENGRSWNGEVPKETIGHIQSAGCLGQKEVVTAAHNACIRELLQEVNVYAAELTVCRWKQSLHQLSVQPWVHGTRQRQLLGVCSGSFVTGGIKGQRGGATDGGTGSTEGSSGVHAALQSSKSKRRSSRGPKWGRVAAAFTLRLSLGFHCARVCARRRRPSWPATCAASEDGADGDVRRRCM